MNYALKIQICIAMLGIAEAWLEVIVIALKNPSLDNYAILNKKEHERSAWYWAAMVFLFIVVSDTWQQAIFLAPALLFNRRLFFEYSLKLFRPGKRIRDIEGDQYWDIHSRRIFGPHGGWWELLVCVTVIVFLNKFFI